MSILSSLKELFDADDKDDASEDNPNFIVRPNRIKQTLRIFMDAHVQITVVMDDDSENASRVLGVTKKGIILDQLLSRVAHNKMMQTTHLRINAKHHAIPFNFESTLIGSTGKSNSFYLISFPEKIYHPQKRSFFRLALAHAEQYKFVGAVKYSENTVTGYIYDISYGGVSVAVNSNTYIKKGDILAPASLTLGSASDKIDCDFTVCSIKKSSVDGFNRIGCKFLNITSPTKKLLHQFIHKQQRKRAKKTAEI